MVSFHMLKSLLLLSVIVDVVVVIVAVVNGFEVFNIIRFVAVDRFHLFRKYTACTDLAGSSRHQI